MKSSEFERLGDWQRKQQLAFEDAKENAVTRKSINTDYQRGGEAPVPSTCISTDRSTLKLKKRLNDFYFKRQTQKSRPRFG